MMARPVSYAAPVAAAARGPYFAAPARDPDENCPFPVFIVIRTDWCLSKRFGRPYDQITTVVSAFTTLIRAHEAALLAFEKFANEYNSGGDVTEENGDNWHSWWNGTAVTLFEDEKKIAEDMKTWPLLWRGTAAEKYEKMVEAVNAVRTILPKGSIFNVERATLPPTARARALNAPLPVPIRMFVLTQNQWDWTIPADETTVLDAFTCFSEARAAGVDAYHLYIHSNYEERERLQWGTATVSAYDKMLENVLADKVNWEKPARECGTSFSIDECFLYPRGTYPLDRDQVTEAAPEADGYIRGYPDKGDAVGGEQVEQDIKDWEEDDQQETWEEDEDEDEDEEWEEDEESEQPDQDQRSEDLRQDSDHTVIHHSEAPSEWEDDQDDVYPIPGNHRGSVHVEPKVYQHQGVGSAGNWHDNLPSESMDEQLEDRVQTDSDCPQSSFSEREEDHTEAPTEPQSEEEGYQSEHFLDGEDDRLEDPIQASDQQNFAQQSVDQQSSDQQCSDHQEEISVERREAPHLNLRLRVPQPQEEFADAEDNQEGFGERDSNGRGLKIRSLVRMKQMFRRMKVEQDSDTEWF